jgi:hypothetical protein
MAANMWRVPVTVVHKVGKHSFVHDNGVMQHAPTDASGWHLFTEFGAGTKGLALIGTIHELGMWLQDRQGTGIDNKISDLPDIYMGVCMYKAGDRFIGCFPVGDSVQALVERLADFAPGSDITDIGGGIGTIASGIKQKIKGFFKSKKPRASSWNSLVVITLHYLEGKGMERIGSGKMTWREISNPMRRQLADLMF